MGSYIHSIFHAVALMLCKEGEWGLEKVPCPSLGNCSVTAPEHKGPVF